MQNARSWVVAGLAALVLACGGGGSGGAGDGGSEKLAFTVPGLGASGFNYTQGTYLLGFVVKPKAAITVTQLGWYDAAQTPAEAGQVFGAHAVGLYDLTSGQLLGSTTIDGASPVSGLFRWKTLAAPVALGKDGVYAVVGITGTNKYTVGILVTEATLGADLTLLSGAGYSSTGTSNAPTQTSTLQVPNAFDAGNIFGNPTPSDVLPDFGPNFRYTAP